MIDPDDPTTIDFGPRQAAAIVPYDVVNGRPVNPVELRGLPGRGELWLWGENAAADPIVIAANPDDGTYRILLIRRDDCGQWAIPGGMVGPGETAKDTLIRELFEKTGVDLRTVEPTILDRAYVYDPRNADEAWICTTAALFLIDYQPQETAGDDAEAAGWFLIGSADDPYGDVEDLADVVCHQTGGESLYPAHLPLLAAAVEAVTSRG